MYWCNKAMLHEDKGSYVPLRPVVKSHIYIFTGHRGAEDHNPWYNLLYSVQSQESLALDLQPRDIFGATPTRVT